MIKDAPLEAEIQMSSRCNLNCSYCIGERISNGDRLPDLIDDRNIIRIVDDLVNCGVWRFKFSGFMGEPLVNKAATLRGIKRIIKHKCAVGLFTNGVLMDEETWPILAQMNYLHLSIDAAYPQKREIIARNIAGLLAQPERRVAVNAGIVVGEDNRAQLSEIVQFAREMQVNLLRIKYDISQPPQNHEGYFEGVRIVQYPTWQRRWGCSFYYTMTTIGSDGKVYICDHNSMARTEPFGDMLTERFADIWPRRHFNCQSDVCPPYGSAFNWSCLK